MVADERKERKAQKFPSVVGDKDEELVSQNEETTPSNLLCVIQRPLQPLSDSPRFHSKLHSSAWSDMKWS